jgi:hypothetical protein
MMLVKVRSRRLLPTTNTLENAIAAPGQRRVEQSQRGERVRQHRVLARQRAGARDEVDRRSGRDLRQPMSRGRTTERHRSSWDARGCSRFRTSSPARPRRSGSETTGRRLIRPSAGPWSTWVKTSRIGQQQQHPAGGRRRRKRASVEAVVLLLVGSHGVDHVAWMSWGTREPIRSKASTRCQGNRRTPMTGDPIGEGRSPGPFCAPASGGQT